MKFLTRTAGGAELVGVLDLAYAQEVVIGLKKTCTVNMYRGRAEKVDKKLSAFFTYIFYTIKERGF